MDISMPGINGIDATRIIRAEMPEVRVIGLSMHEDVEMRCKMQEAGAKACYHKAARWKNSSRQSGRDPISFLICW